MSLNNTPSGERIHIGLFEDGTPGNPALSMQSPDRIWQSSPISKAPPPTLS